MSATLTVSSAVTDVEQWNSTLKAFRDRYKDISTTDREAYEPRRLAVAELRTARGLIEKRRKEITAPALAFQKDVKAKADFVIAEIEKIEEPLLLANRAIDEEAARLKRIAEQDERDKQQTAEKAAFEAHRQRQEKEAEAERARLKEEADKLQAEKQRLGEEGKAAREEAARVQAENLRQREEIAAEQLRIKKIQDAIEAERIAKEKAAAAEAKRIADEAAAKERERLEEERRQAMLPDVDKIRSWADQIDAVIETAPAVNSDDGFLALNDAFTVLANLATKLRGFGS